MPGRKAAKRPGFLALLASSSAAALLIGSGGPAGACYTGPFAGGHTNSGATACIVVNNTSFSGNLGNSGTISPGPTGIAIINGSTITGSVTNTGVISAANKGILIDGTSKINSNATSILIAGPTFTGGISNVGTISASGSSAGAISVSASTFSGGISNVGTISGARFGINISQSTSFAGGITNPGMILTVFSGNGIVVSSVSTFTGGITNSGTMSGGISVIVSSVSTFTGGITNSGTISGGIGVSSVSAFNNGITNSGTISGSIQVGGLSSFSGGITNSSSGKIGSAIQVGGMSSFSGGISNAGTISGGIGLSNVLNFTAGISNSGAIGGIGIVNDVSNFSGGISNAGTITDGILLATRVSISGGISNNGTISGLTGIAVLFGSTISGGISDSGVISASRNGILIDRTSRIVSSRTGISMTGPTFVGGVSNAGAISAHTAGIVVDHVSTFSGGISNSGTIAATTGIAVHGGVGFAAGPGIVNSGTITGTVAAIDVSQATSPVTIDQTGGLISGDVKLSHNADVLAISGGSIQGNVVGAGSSDTITFNMGSGSFTYGSAFGFTGINQVTINSGTVVLNGANSASNVDVNGGTLAGTGSIDPTTLTIHAGGTFAPGTPGVAGTSMSIVGNLALQSGAIYLVQVNPTTASFATVTGTASLAGTANAVFANGTYISKVYTILTAGSVTGTFGTLVNTNLPANFHDSLSYDPTHAYLDLTLNFAVPPAGTLTLNQQNVANALINSFNTSGGIPMKFGALTPAQLTMIDGEYGTGAERGAFALTNQYLELLLDPFTDGRGSLTGGGLGFAPEREASLPPEIALAYAGVFKAPPKSASFDQRWRAWAAGFGGTATTNGDPSVGTNTVTASTYGYAAGADYRASPNTVLGFSLAGGGTGWNLANALGTGRSNAVLASVYGVTRAGPWSFGGALAFANNWFTTNRTAIDDQLSANFQGQSYAARLEGGYRFVAPVLRNAIGVTPYAAIQVQDFHTPGYSEADLSGGGFGLTYASQNATDTRGELGARFDTLQVVGGMPLVLRGRLAWAHDWFSNAAVLNAAFQVLPGSNFTVNGAAPPRDSALTTAAAELHITPNWTAIAKFEGEFGSGAQTYAGAGTLRYSW